MIPSPSRAEQAERSGLKTRPAKARRNLGRMQVSGEHADLALFRGEERRQAGDRFAGFGSDDFLAGRRIDEPRKPCLCRVDIDGALRGSRIMG
jgi:hypothetical protein